MIQKLEKDQFLVTPKRCAVPGERRGPALHTHLETPELRPQDGKLSHCRCLEGRAAAAAVLKSNFLISYENVLLKISIIVLGIGRDFKGWESCNKL